MSEGITCYERDETLCEDPMCARVGCRLRNDRLARSSTDIIELADLPLYWQGRANALGLLNDRRVEPDARTISLIETYEECAKELRAALSGVAQAETDPFVEAMVVKNALWPADVGGDKGVAVAWAVFAANGNIRMWSAINADVEGFAKQIGAVVTPLYAAQQPASNAYSSQQSLNDEERHAVEHALYRVSQASIVQPDCCFDYDLVKVLLRAIDRAYPVPSTPRGTAADYCHAHQGPVRLEGDKCPLCSTEGR